jgi:hypothetical protein
MPRSHALFIALMHSSRGGEGSAPGVKNRVGVRRGLGFAFIAAALLSSACAAGADRRAELGGYRKLSESLGFPQAIEDRVLEDGGTLELTITDKAGAPVRGVRLVIGRGAKRRAARSDRGGRLSFPVSDQLARENPKVTLIGPRPGESFRMSFNFSFRCEALGKPGREIDVRGRGFRAFPAGVDRVYAERGVPDEEARAAAELLAAERAALEELLGERPPPLAVALLATEDGVTRAAGDAEGRSVWTLKPSQRQDDIQRIGTVVHEWMHAFLKTRYRLDDAIKDAGLRYLEDGFCELMAELVYERLRGAGPSSQAAARLKELKGAKLPAEIDLLALGERDSPGRYGSMYEFMRSLCRKDSGAGYALGLAFWLAALDESPARLREFLQRLDAGGYASSGDIAAHIGGARGSIVRLEDALATLEKRAAGKKAGNRE